MVSAKIKKFKVENFRNLILSVVDLHPNLNFLHGENGNGKTNFLESIHFALSGKSFKKNSGFEQIISFDSDIHEILFSFILEETSLDSTRQNLFNYSGKIAPNHVFWSKNNNPLSSKKNFYPTVFMGAHHPYEFYSAPKFRRDWFDSYISQTDKSYEKNNARYSKFLKNRNKLILKAKNGQKIDSLQINAIDKNLAQLIPLLVASKIAFIDKIKKNSQNLFYEIFQESYEIDLFLNSKFKDLSENIVYNYLNKNIPRDLILGHTSEGVHKDDYGLLINGLDVLDFASLGQQKIIYLSLLFAAIRVLQNEKKIDPIILIDDLSNEIDNKRWKNLIEFLIRSDFQVIITSANHLFLQSFQPHLKSKSFEIVAGEIVSKKK